LPSSTATAAWLFWLLFVVLAVWLQFIFPGMDFLAAGLVLCLQQERPGKVLLLAIICVLIQESTGPLAFGTSVLRYGALIVFFLLARRLFEANNPVLILILGGLFAVVHYLSLKTMTGLQSLVILDQRIFIDSVLLFFVFSTEWFVLSKIYQKIVLHAATRS
jgi:hypothetical protein